MNRTHGPLLSRVRPFPLSDLSAPGAPVKEILLLFLAAAAGALGFFLTVHSCR